MAGRGGPPAGLHDWPSFYVPADAASMEVWFVNTSIDCRGEGAYDSDYGANYHYDVAR